LCPFWSLTCCFVSILSVGIQNQSRHLCLTNKPNKEPSAMARPWMAAVALAAACLVVGAEGGSLTDIWRRQVWGGGVFNGRKGTGADRALHQGMGHRRMRRNAEKAQVNDSAPAQAPEKISSHKRITCEKKKNHMTCKEGIIRVTSAMYGRTDKKECARGRPAAQLEKTDCTSDKTDLFARKGKIGCNNKKKCVTRVTNKVMDEDPCIGTFKYLEVTWDCIQKESKGILRRRRKTKRRKNQRKGKKNTK